jgi:hypothetical protein
MSGRMILGLVISISGIIFSAFYFFWASSGKSPTFNDIVEEIAREKRKLNEDYTAKEVKEVWQVVSFLMLVGFIIAFIIVIVN